MKQRVVHIGVMGVTGSGKSTFIKTATEDDSVVVGGTFKSCTVDVKPYSFFYEDMQIILIDTPGFNDTTRSETEVLREIASWLDTTYRNPPRIKLSGIIYMQALEDRRMYGSTLRNLRMFREICGDEPLKNVIFTTSGWGLARKADQLDKAIQKESELCIDTDFWKPMLDRGAQTAKFEDTRKSALEIIMRLVPRRPVVLQIQQELVDDNKNLIDTKAGTTVNEEVKALEAKYQAEIAQIKIEMQRALDEQDHEYKGILEEHTAKLEKLRDEARRAQDMLQYQRRMDDRRHETEMQDLRIAFENQKRTAQEVAKRSVAEAAAQKYEDELEFEGIVSRLRENFDRVRKEEMEVMEAKIKEMEAEMAKEKTKKKKGRGKKLLLAILPMVGNIALSAVGFVLGVGPFAGLS